MAKSNHIEIERWSDEKLGPGQDCSAGRFRVQNGAGAQENAVAQLLPYLPDHVEGVWHRECNFHDGDAAIGERFRNFNQLMAIRRSHHRNDAASDHAFNVFVTVHFGIVGRLERNGKAIVEPRKTTGMNPVARPLSSSHQTVQPFREFVVRSRGPEKLTDRRPDSAFTGEGRGRDRAERQ